MFEKIRLFLEGYKTYIVLAFAVALTGIESVYPEFSTPDFVWAALAALGAGFVKARINAIAKGVASDTESSSETGE